MENYKYAILGGGLAAGYAAQEFAHQGIHPGELCIISAEKTLPYERPSLSKDFLADKESVADILINDASFYKENGIDVKLNTLVTHIDLDNKQLDTQNGSITYEKLLIATGSTPHEFELPGANLKNIYYLRQLSDARDIRQMAHKAHKAVVIGGGFIGMETTAVLQSQGVDTTMIFPEERVWQAFFTPDMSSFFEDYYRERGVTILPRQRIASFAGDERVTAVITQSGERLDADMVVAGIGVAPDDDLLGQEAFDMKAGCLLVNRFLETSAPDVYAAGDITYYKDVIFDRPMHIEHWDNAVQQGQHAARGMMGMRQLFEHVPYFFSDVFDLSYEFWGDTTGAAEVVHRGEVENGRFSKWWLAENGRLLAAFVMNRPEEERECAPAWIKSGKQLSADWLREEVKLQLSE